MRENGLRALHGPRRRYLTLVEARTDVFDYIERFHNPLR